MNPPENIRILLVEDHQILIDGIKKMLEWQEFIVVGEALNSAQALAILEKTPVDVMITDIQMPGEDGIELIKKAKKRYPDLKTIVLTMHEERSIVLDAVQIGVDGYLLKNTTQRQFINAIKKAMEGRTTYSEEISSILAEKVRSKDDRRLLSERELEILKLVANDYTNEQIAEKLFISERTVESHRKNIYAKTGTKSIVSLMKYAMENKLI